MPTELRVATATDESLAACIRKGIWAGRKFLGQNWKKGQLLLVRIDHDIAAVAVVMGEIRMDPKASIDRDLPKVVPVQWVWLAEREGDRIRLGEWYFRHLRALWGGRVGLKMLNQTPLPSAAAHSLLTDCISRSTPAAREGIERAQAVAEGAAKEEAK